MSDEAPDFTLLDRCANQAARAIVKEIERHTGEALSLYMMSRVINCIGAMLESSSIQGGPPGELRRYLEQPYKKDGEL